MLKYGFTVFHKRFAVVFFKSLSQRPCVRLRPFEPYKGFKLLLRVKSVHYEYGVWQQFSKSPDPSSAVSMNIFEECKSLYDRLARLLRNRKDERNDERMERMASKTASDVYLEAVEGAGNKTPEDL